MLKAKLKNTKKVTKQINENAYVNYTIENGTMLLESNANVVGFELDVKGKFQITSSSDQWLLKANKNKIIAVDLTAQGFKNSSVLQFKGEMRIIKALTVDSDQKIINKIRSNDKDLYVWNLSKGNKYNVNTTAWTDLTSKNKKSLKTQNDDNPYASPAVSGASGIGGG